MEFFDYTPYLLPLTIMLLASALGVLAMHASRSGQRTPLIIGVAGAALMLLGKFVFELDWLNFRRRRSCDHLVAASISTLTVMPF
ncbi:MAG: hypothetical protein HY661_10325 [Betaproteobacteria bacterium]|nr:hypothetical protein [Betaproteobacteria bacterium]